MPPRHIWQKLFDTSCDDNQIENQRRVTTSPYLPSWVGLTAGRGPFVLVACTYVLQPGIDVLQAYMLVDEPRLIWRCTLIPTCPPDCDSPVSEKVVSLCVTVLRVGRGAVSLSTRSTQKVGFSSSWAHQCGYEDYPYFDLIC